MYKKTDTNTNNALNVTVSTRSNIADIFEKNIAVI